MVGSPKIRRRMDGLSELPDSMLLYAMSFMDMKSVVRTSVLSKRWRKLWKSILDMDFQWLQDNSFFVDQSIALHTGSKIRKFRVSAEHDLCPHEQVDSWVSFAVNRNVEELCLDFFPTNGDELDMNTDRYETPRCIFTCASLVSLTLRRCNINLPASIGLPVLSSLTLERTDFADDLIKDLISGCPLFEDLTLYDCNRCYDLNIFAELTLERTDFADDLIKDLISGCPLFEDLTLYDCNRCYDLNIFAENSRLKSLKVIEWDYLVSHETKLQIFAPNLLSLDFVDHMPRKSYEVKDLSSLIVASFNFDALLENQEYSTTNFVEILDQIRHVKVLKLCTACIVELSIREMRVPNASVTFGSTTLVLKTGFCKFELPGLAYILRSFISLEILVIDVAETDDSYKFEDYFQDEFDFDENEYWKSVDTLFLVMLQHLKCVKIHGIDIGTAFVGEPVAVEDAEKENLLIITKEGMVEEILKGKGKGKMIEFMRILLQNSAVVETLHITTKHGGYYADCVFIC